MTTKQKIIKIIGIAFFLTMTTCAIFSIFGIFSVLVIKMFLGCVTLEHLALAIVSVYLYDREFIGAHTLSIHNISLEKQNWELKQRVQALDIHLKKLSGVDKVC